MRVGQARVVGLGGGTFVDADNRELIEEDGVSIWLDAPAEELWERVKAETHRPLAQDGDAFLQRHADRREAYSQADFRMNGSQTADAIVAEIRALKLI